MTGGLGRWALKGWALGGWALGGWALGRWALGRWALGRGVVAPWAVAPWAVALSALLALGCDPSPATQFLVEIDSDLEVPLEVDRLRASVDGEVVMERLEFGRPSGFPQSVAVVRTGGSLGPITILVEAQNGERVLVAQTATVSFIEGRALRLPIFLARRCVAVECTRAHTCRAGDCFPDFVEASELDEVMPADAGRLDGGRADANGLDADRPDSGSPDAGSLDAGSLDAGLDGGVDACVVSAETCNMLDDDCDTRVDETFDFQTDPLNCGACANACTPAAGGNVCEAGRCVPGECLAGFGDCDGDPTNGCEARVDTLARCGACDTPCAPTNAMARCSVDGMCEIRRCDAGFDDCDGVANNGCEADLASVATCGACDVSCVRPNQATACTGGACEFMGCDAGFDDCDGDPDTGCEVDLMSDRDHCGACGTRCRGTTPNCLMGACGA